MDSFFAGYTNVWKINESSLRSTENNACHCEEGHSPDVAISRREAMGYMHPFASKTEYSVGIGMYPAQTALPEIPTGDLLPRNDMVFAGLPLLISCCAVRK